MSVKALFNLTGKTALITGGSRGLGLQMAEALGEMGARLAITARKSDELAEAKAHLQGLGYQVETFTNDLQKFDTIPALVDDVLARCGDIDILVNNAGAAWGVPFEEFPESGWDKVMDLNVKSPFFLTQALHGLLKAAGTPGRPAKVINITSIDGQRLNPWETYSYHASKSALIYLTKRMAARLVRDHVNVTSIAPGAFASDMNKAARDHGDDVAQGIPAGRIGTDEDMAGAAIYLASRAGDYVIGETITVDGGLVHAALGTSIDA